jgi:hypothetical protein
VSLSGRGGRSGSLIGMLSTMTLSMSLFPQRLGEVSFMFCTAYTLTSALSWVRR